MAASSHNIHPIPSVSMIPSVSSQKRRRNLVKAACNRCRAGKVKCDGKRPRCGRCSKLNDEELCEYDVDDGDTRQDALRKRTAEMQKSLHNAIGFIEALKDMPAEQVEQALAGVRAASDVQSFLEHFSAINTPGQGAYSSSSGISPDDQPIQYQRDSFFNLSASAGGGIAPRRQDDTRLSGLPNGDLVPYQHLIEEALKTFFDCSSKLFHVFSRAEMRTCTDQIYKSSASNPPRTAMASVFSVCAVGCAYMRSGLGQDFEEALFDRAKMCLDDAIESCPMKAAKVCCMLGMKLLFMKNRASLTFIEMGLELCRREGMDLQTKPFDQPEEQWRDGRKTFRTLFFLASWLSASVGYLSRSSCWVEAFGHPDVNIRGETSLEDLVQTAMVKVSLLKFNILRFNLNGKPLTSLSIGAMSRDLKKCYDELPPQVHLSNVRDPAIPIPLRRTVYFCHLLYLGCVILLARRIVHSEITSGNTILLSPQLNNSETFIQDGVTAAQQSARILSVLRQEQGVFKRCWLCIFQSYVALTMNLFALAKQLLARNYDAANELSDCAASCMDVLDYCSAEDAVATRFHASCQPIFVMLNGYRRARLSDADLRQACEQLLDMFCMPFGDAAEDHVPVIKGWSQCESADTRLHDYSLVISREQDFEASTPFHRKTRNIAPGPRVRGLLDSLGPSRFLYDVEGEAWPDALRQG